MGSIPMGGFMIFISRGQGFLFSFYLFQSHSATTRRMAWSNSRLDAVIVLIKQDCANNPYAAPSDSLQQLIPAGWRELLRHLFVCQTWKNLAERWQHEVQLYGESRLLPTKSQYVFRCLSFVSIKDIRVVIVGQSPTSDGLAYSTQLLQADQRVDTTLENVLRERNTDVGGEKFLPRDTDVGMLDRWAEQGVCLLNETMTGRLGEFNAHRSFGWEHVCNSLLELISSSGKHIVFMLWGSAARAKLNHIRLRNQHCVLSASHPSQHTAAQGFFGCKHFTQANKYLRENGKTPIRW
jgi:uracil-DNA glycosylase